MSVRRTRLAMAMAVAMGRAAVQIALMAMLEMFA